MAVWEKTHLDEEVRTKSDFFCQVRQRRTVKSTQWRVSHMTVWFSGCSGSLDLLYLMPSSS